LNALALLAPPMRTLGALLARRHALAVLAFTFTFAIAGPARAQVARNFTPRFNVQTTGDVTLIGNTIMTCAADGQCASAQAGGGGGNINNQNFTMQYVDMDGDATTFSSSSATLSLPSGATVLFAGLYWGGFSAAASRNTAKLALPGGGYSVITAQQLDAIGADQGLGDLALIEKLVKAAVGLRDRPRPHQQSLQEKQHRHRRRDVGERELHLLLRNTRHVVRSSVRTRSVMCKGVRCALAKGSSASLLGRSLVRRSSATPPRSLTLAPRI